ncbi:SIR2 family NAD-dependent protein deacylase, partial [Nocardia asiatica]|uniref:SIR2 family NAD-dependent protein deacylase n=1 Tax=Nocardia asiatica TaxID=209252 RepID=UPI002454A0F2
PNMTVADLRMPPQPGQGGSGSPGGPPPPGGGPGGGVLGLFGCPFYRKTLRGWPPPVRGGPAGEPDPPCPGCGGILKSATVMFGQQMDRRTVTKAALVAETSDIFLAIGTSLQVEPAASMCSIAVRGGADLVIVNAEPTPYDAMATEIIREPIGTAVPRLVAELLAE